MKIRFRVIIFLAALYFSINCTSATGAAHAERFNQKIETWIAGGFYEGDIGGVPFQMNLEYPRENIGIKNDWIYFTSEYWYPQRLTNQRTRLNATLLDIDGKIFRLEAIVKYDRKLNRPYKEYFTGIWDEQLATAHGIWFSETSGKSAPFHMKLKIRYRAEQISFVTQDSIDYLNGRHTVHSKLYPEFMDKRLIIEQDRLGLVNDEKNHGNTITEDVDDDEETEDALMVAWASNHYLFLRRDSSFYGFGAAHPTADRGFLHFKREKQGFAPAPKSDFLISNKRCVKQLSEGILAALKEESRTNLENANVTFDPDDDPFFQQRLDRINATAASDDEWSSYLFSPNGLAFFFGEYSFGSFSETHDVFVNKEQLKGCIKKFPQYSPVVQEF